jgi:hypothetical protein
MKKLRLDIDSLRVESFASAEEEAQRGTVAGLQIVSYHPDCPYTWNPYKYTCGQHIECGQTG